MSSDDSTAEATVAGNSVLDDWFRHVGTQLSDEDYEAGIKAIASRDTEVAELREQLGEAQATIAKVRAYAEDRAFHAKGHLNTVNSGRIASDLLAILSAPSSTRGETDGE